MTIYETISLMIAFATLMTGTIFGILALTVELIKMYTKEDTKIVKLQEKETQKNNALSFQT